MRDHGAWEIIAAVAAVLWLDPSTASATSSLGIDLRGAAGEPCAESCAGWTLGWTFQIASPVQVRALGLWDEGSDGLVESHPIGLWTKGGVLLASATVSSSSSLLASSASGLGQWVFEGVDPLVLDPGTYVLGAAYGSSSDPWRFRADGSEFALGPHLSNPNFTWYARGSGLGFPDSPAVDEAGYFGPNLWLSSAPSPGPLVTPEPSTAALLSGGLLLLAAMRPRANSAASGPHLSRAGSV